MQRCQRACGDTVDLPLPRITALLNRDLTAEGVAPVNHKRFYLIVPCLSGHR